jgi:carbonic anhydrase/acetyltransferase-like protein (isoleucine patch superfamily)
VVGNADICGNVMLTSGSSAEQRVQIRATTASTTTTSGVGGVWRAGVEGNVNVGGNVGITENVFVGGKMDNGNVDICGNVFCSSEPRFPSELTNKKYVDSLITGILRLLLET